MTPTQIFLETEVLHANQRLILDSPARYKIGCCGRRWGKTMLAVHSLLEPLLQGHPCGWFAPNFRDLSEAWRACKRVLQPATARCSDAEWRLELVSGGVLEAWSLHDNPDAGRSRRYKHVVIDECSKAGNLEQAWNEAIRPTLADLHGTALFISTPKGRGFFHRVWSRGQDEAQSDWRSWRFPTGDNPYIDPAEIAKAQKDLPDRVFKQEFLAEFMDDAGGVFRGVLAAVDQGRTAEVERQTWEADQKEYGHMFPGRRDEKTYCMGVDLARVDDFTVVSVIDSTRKQVWWGRWNQISWERQIGGILHVAHRFRPWIWCDATGIGDAIYERLKREGLSVIPFVFTNASKLQLIDNLAGAIEQGRIRLLDEPVQTSELLDYEYRLSPTRKVQMGAPEGQHDDAVVALALSWWGMDGPQACHSGGAW